MKSKTRLRLLVETLPSDVCLVRGKEVDDAHTRYRWFAYFGAKYNPSKYQRALKFATMYAGDRGLEFYRTKKRIHLLVLPYLQTTGEDERDNQAAETMAVIVANALVSLVLQQKTSLAVVDRHGLSKVVANVFDALVSFVDDPRFENSTVQTAYKNKGQSDPNPDFVFAQLICELGYDGWIRTANLATKEYADSDEVMFCDIHRLEKQGFVTPCQPCDVRKSKTTGK